MGARGARRFFDLAPDPADPEPDTDTDPEAPIPNPPLFPVPPRKPA
jgi:hypothetical protein